MPVCKDCQKTFKGQPTIDGKVRNLRRRRRCLACLPFGDGDAARHPELRQHPDLVVDYFEGIGTVEQAYWFGFLSADGYVTDGGRLVLELSTKDEAHLLNFTRTVGADPNAIWHRTQKNGVRSVRLTISRREFTDHLVRLGCGPRKSRNLNLADLGSEALNLAYLLGMYDGDGGADSTTLYSGCTHLLEQIRERYGLSYEIRSIKRGCSELTLGVALFRRMILTYGGGLQRKRRTHRPGPNHGKARKDTKRFHVSKRKLESLLDRHPASRVGEMFGVTGAAIRKRALKLGITPKGRGEWARLRAGR